MGGDSLAPATSNRAGTLGYFVTKKNAVGVLSNCHVMEAVGNKLLSPAKLDGGTDDDYIGTVKDIALSHQLLTVDTHRCEGRSPNLSLKMARP